CARGAYCSNPSYFDYW
nr:immunoglobulin heavy chain junction region [Mus musculus]MBK4197159.1 immunoglobulin heavy chain junction region [Mus musculus]